MDIKGLLVTFFLLAIVGVIAGVAWVIIKDHSKGDGGGSGVKLSDMLFKKKDKH